MDISWVYELQSGDVEEIDIAKIQHETTELRNSCLSYENIGWDPFLATVL